MSVGINRVHTGGGSLRGGAGEAPGSGRQGTVPVPLRPHHLEAQDTDLSRRSHRFESGWGYARLAIQEREKRPGLASLAESADAVPSKGAVHQGVGVQIPRGARWSLRKPLLRSGDQVGSGDRVALSLCLGRSRS